MKEAGVSRAQLPENYGGFPAGAESGGPAAAELLRPWLESQARAMVPDGAMASLAAQQVLVDLQSRPAQVFRSSAELEDWLTIRVTQTVALFTGTFTTNALVGPRPRPQEGREPPRPREAASRLGGQLGWRRSMARGSRRAGPAAVTIVGGERWPLSATTRMED